MIEANRRVREVENAVADEGNRLVWCRPFDEGDWGRGLERIAERWMGER